MSDLDLWPQDAVFLAEGVLLKNNDLLDLMTNRCVTLNEVAVLLIGSLGKEKSIGEAVDSVSAVNGWDCQEVTGDLIDLLDELDKSALLVVKKHWKARLAPSALWLQLISWLSLDWPRPATKRYAPTITSLACACFRVSRWGFFVSGAMTLVLLTATLTQGSVPIPYGKYVYAALPLLLYTGFVGHVIVHEFGHLLAINSLGSSFGKYVFARGSRVGVAHDIFVLKERRIIALCGPVAGVLGAQLVALSFLAIPLLSPYAGPISLSGIIHLYSLFPWTADGKQIWQRKNRSES